eukprot:m.50342 g.50342  ORF g.50342 m.50342 type:complete len:389 (-) comp10880_c1_seq1:40-1206(-)
MERDRVSVFAEKWTGVGEAVERTWRTDTINAIANIKQLIASAKEAIQSDEEYAEVCLKTNFKTFKKKTKQLSDAHKSGYSKAAKFSTSLSKTSTTASLSSIDFPVISQDDKKHLFALVSDYLQRRGDIEACRQLEKEAGVSYDKAHVDMMEQMHKVVVALHEHDLGPLQSWMIDNHSACSDGLLLLFLKLQIVQLLADGKTSDALQLSQTQLPSLYEKHSAEVNKLMRAFVLGDGVKEDKDFVYYFSDNVWLELSQVFSHLACAAMDIHFSSPLTLCINAGCDCVVPILKWMELSEMTNTKSLWFEDDTMPIETPSNSSFQPFHSIFVCPISRSLASVADPPAILRCGHAMNSSSAKDIASSSSRRVVTCSYCPESTSVNGIRVMKKW